MIQAGTLEAAVAGLETLASLEQLSAFIDLFGPSRLIFSLDLNAGRPLTQLSAWRDQSPEHIAAAAAELGIERIIILDLARVGTGEGIGTEALARTLRQQHPHLELIGGGGIRGPEDLRHLAIGGYSAALVASALHDGRIKPSEI